MSAGGGCSWLFCVGAREIPGRKILTAALGADGSRGPDCVIAATKLRESARTVVP